jgi:1-acyl-sn-glycerol-3-phosphate acyltransferase
MLRPELLGVTAQRLSLIERANVRLVRASFRPGFVDKCLRLLQRTVGQTWIHYATRNLTQVVGLEHLPDLQGQGSFLVVANHRSFFDLYVVTAELIRRGMKKRIVFMVRSNFFYDSVLGFFVNFFMSFLAMYPPVFRERKKLAMNPLALDELSWLLRQNGVFAGIHPEGTRNRDSDPYTLLPAKPGVGRIIRQAGVPVIPVFVNGLGNEVLKQVRGNFDGTGQKITIVFGAAISFDDLLAAPASARLDKELADRCMDAVSSLGAQEKALRTCGP